MKRSVSVLLCCLLLAMLVTPVLAAPEAPVITLQPQSPNYPHYSVAIYTVKATGSNLHATWFMEWQGSIYEISAIGGAMQPWEAFAGEAYGARQVDSNTFTFIFEGIERDLDGAYIWCVLEDGHYSLTSQRARISVGNENTPPTILDIPASLTVPKGANAEIRCVAQAPEGTQLTYLWYESHTGKIEDITAVNRGTETSDSLVCDTSVVGIRNYICFVDTSAGGFANSSFVTVTVTDSAPDQPSFLTDKLPEATAGDAYRAELKCSDPNAKFTVSYNPGKANDFDKTGLTLSDSGVISGTPIAPGSYTFCICAGGAGGEDYMVYTLTVKEAPAPTETTAPTEATAPPETSEPAESEPTTPKPTPEPTKRPEKEAPSDSAGSGLPWWALILAGLAAAGAGMGAAVLLVNKKR